MSLLSILTTVRRVEFMLCLMMEAPKTPVRRSYLIKLLDPKGLSTYAYNFLVELEHMGYLQKHIFSGYDRYIFLHKKIRKEWYTLPFIEKILFQARKDDKVIL